MIHDYRIKHDWWGGDAVCDVGHIIHCPECQRDAAEVRSDYIAEIGR
jgi:hypothetical protein